MDEISLAALLGAVPWLGAKFTRKSANAIPPVEATEASPVAADSDADRIDYEDDRPEFIWPQGPIFQ